MENKVFYSAVFDLNVKVKGVTKVTQENFVAYKQNVLESMILQQSWMQWKGMWDANVALNRIQKGQILYLLRDSRGALGHLWMDKNYMHNVFVHPRRKDNLSVDFVKTVLSDYKSSPVGLYCDDWNIKAQKFFEKIGFKKSSFCSWE